MASPVRYGDGVLRIHIVADAGTAFELRCRSCQTVEMASVFTSLRRDESPVRYTCEANQ
jgi:hypothetical protein